MKAIAIVLIVLGVLGLGYGGLTWTRRDTVVDAGPVEITRDKRESLPIPPLAGAALLVVGVVLLMKRGNWRARRPPLPAAGHPVAPSRGSGVPFRDVGPACGKLSVRTSHRALPL